MTSKPIRIGYCLSLTGPVAGNARSARLAHEIWRDDVNREGGLLGRPVELICYDDEGDARRVRGLYAQLIEQDGVDLILGGYGTNTLLAAMPLVVSHERYFVGLMGLGVNNVLEYDRYFAMIPTGPDPNSALTEGFFALGAAQTPRARTVALLSADAEFSRNPVLGAHANAARHGFEVVFEETYPLGTEDFTSILDRIAATEADLLFLCSYLDDSVRLVRAVNAHPWRPAMVGGAMIGPQNTMVKTALGADLNGFVNYEYWTPAAALMFDGSAAFLDIYQSRAAQAGVDALGHYTALLAYAQTQVLAQAVAAVGGFDDADLAAYSRDATFRTVMGEIRFGARGEWREPRVLQVQFQDIEGGEVEQFRSGKRQIVVHPPALASGRLRYPYNPDPADGGPSRGR